MKWSRRKSHTWVPAKGSKEYDKPLSAKATIDLASLVVPISLTIKCKDLLKSQYQSASAKVVVLDSVKIFVGGGYNIKYEKISASEGIEYSAEKITASADVSFSIKRDQDSCSYSCRILRCTYQWNNVWAFFEAKHRRNKRYNNKPFG